MFGFTSAFNAHCQWHLRHTYSENTNVYNSMDVSGHRMDYTLDGCNKQTNTLVRATIVG